VVVNPATPIGVGDLKPTPSGKIIVDYINRRMPAYVNTGLNFIDVEDVAKGHLLALEKGRVGERYILGNRNLTLQDVFRILEEITGIKAPKVRIPIALPLAVAYVDEFISGKLRHKPPRVPLAGVKMSQKPMYYSAAKAIAELGLPQSPIESAFEKAVRWYYDQGYA
jgi:dihydroflavonol-4-reductase